jgi:RES domain-containing protein
LIRLWRVYRKLFGPSLDGEGALHAPGRWNSLGNRAVYFGGTAAIVVLEKLVHLDPEVIESDLMLGTFEADLGFEDVWPADVDPWENGLQDIAWTRRNGDKWLTGMSSTLLRVPSAILPEEYNFMFNPKHPDAGKLKLIDERPFAFDGRLLS